MANSTTENSTPSNDELSEKEMQAKKAGKTIINEHKTKRGKNSL